MSDEVGDTLALWFTSSVPTQRRGEVARLADLGPRLVALVADARRAWPKIDVSPEVFVRHVAERVGAEQDLDASLRAVRAAELYLVCACVAGDRRALAEFDRVFLSEVGRYIGKLDASPSFADDVKQLLREKLFVPSRGRPRILDYAGRGPLGGWLRVAAVRTARNLQRSTKSPVRAVQGVDDRIRTAKPDPELGYIKRRYAREFQDAFEKTLGELAPRERNILRLYFLEAMSSSAIAAAYHVSGATVRVWIKQWREAILAETRRRLAARLQIDTGDVDSVMALIESQFDLTVSRLLR